MQIQMSNSNSSIIHTAALENTETTLVYKKHFYLWGLFILSAISFLTTLSLPYQGEEAVYTKSSLEMWYHKQWFVPLIFGNEYGRPPLYNWAIIAVASHLGWEQVLIAARMVTSLVTLGSTFLLFYFTEKLFSDRKLTLLTVCIYLSGDLLLRRGWLAYADPFFSFFVFLSLMSLWFCVENRNVNWIFLAAIGLIGAYLSKAFTGHLFYGVTFLVLLWRHPNAKILITSPLSIAIHSFSLFFILIWGWLFAQGAHQHSMILDIVTRCNFEALSSYLLKLFTFPLDSFYRWLPASGILLYFYLKETPILNTLNQPTEVAKVEKVSKIAKIEKQKYLIKLIFWIFFLNYLLYWVAPFARVRYLLPLYPFIAILLAYGLYQFRQERIQLAIYLLWGCLLVKYFLGCFAYSYYEQNHRGCYQTTAQDILKSIGDFPLYVNKLSATGLSVTAHLDILRLPQSPLTESPVAYLWKSGFILSDETVFRDMPDLKIVKIYPFGTRQIYLLCRGRACIKNEEGVRKDFKLFANSDS